MRADDPTASAEAWCRGVGLQPLAPCVAVIARTLELAVERVHTRNAVGLPPKLAEQGDQARATSGEGDNRTGVTSGEGQYNHVGATSGEGLLGVKGRRTEWAGVERPSQNDLRIGGGRLDYPLEPVEEGEGATRWSMLGSAGEAWDWLLSEVTLDEVPGEKSQLAARTRSLEAEGRGLPGLGLCLDFHAELCAARDRLRAEPAAATGDPLSLKGLVGATASAVAIFGPKAVHKLMKTGLTCFDYFVDRTGSNWVFFQAELEARLDSVSLDADRIMSPRVPIIVNTTSYPCVIYARLEGTVQELMDLIREKTAIPMGHLMFGAKPLQGEKRLQDYGIQAGSQLYLGDKLRGGVRTSVDKVDEEATDKDEQSEEGGSMPSDAAVEQSVRATMVMALSRLCEIPDSDSRWKGMTAERGARILHQAGLDPDTVDKLRDGPEIHAAVELAGRIAQGDASAARQLVAIKGRLTREYEPETGDQERLPMGSPEERVPSKEVKGLVGDDEGEGPSSCQEMFGSFYDEMARGKRQRKAWDAWCNVVQIAGFLRDLRTKNRFPETEVGLCVSMVPPRVQDWEDTMGKRGKPVALLRLQRVWTPHEGCLRRMVVQGIAIYASWEEAEKARQDVGNSPWTQYWPPSVAQFLDYDTLQSVRSERRGGASSAAAFVNVFDKTWEAGLIQAGLASAPEWETWVLDHWPSDDLFERHMRGQKIIVEQADAEAQRELALANEQAEEAIREVQEHSIVLRCNIREEGQYRRKVGSVAKRLRERMWTQAVIAGAEPFRNLEAQRRAICEAIGKMVIRPVEGGGITDWKYDVEGKVTMEADKWEGGVVAQKVRPEHLHFFGPFLKQRLAALRSHERALERFKVLADQYVLDKQIQAIRTCQQYAVEMDTMVELGEAERSGYYFDHRIKWVERERQSVALAQLAERYISLELPPDQQQALQISWDEYRTRKWERAQYVQQWYVPNAEELQQLQREGTLTPGLWKRIRERTFRDMHQHGRKVYQPSKAQQRRAMDQALRDEGFLPVYVGEEGPSNFGKKKRLHGEDGLVKVLKPLKPPAPPNVGLCWAEDLYYKPEATIAVLQANLQFGGAVINLNVALTMAESALKLPSTSGKGPHSSSDKDQNMVKQEAGREAARDNLKLCRFFFCGASVDEVKEVLEQMRAEQRILKGVMTPEGVINDDFVINKATGSTTLVWLVHCRFWHLLRWVMAEGRYQGLTALYLPILHAAQQSYGELNPALEMLLAEVKAEGGDLDGATCMTLQYALVHAAQRCDWSCVQSLAEAVTSRGGDPNLFVDLDPTSQYPYYEVRNWGDGALFPIENWAQSSADGVRIAQALEFVKGLLDHPQFSMDALLGAQELIRAPGEHIVVKLVRELGRMGSQKGRPMVEATDYVLQVLVLMREKGFQLNKLGMKLAEVLSDTVPLSIIQQVGEDCGVSWSQLPSRESLRGRYFSDPSVTPTGNATLCQDRGRRALRGQEELEDLHQRHRLEGAGDCHPAVVRCQESRAGEGTTGSTPEPVDEHPAAGICDDMYNPTTGRPWTDEDMAELNRQECERQKAAEAQRKAASPNTDYTPEEEEEPVTALVVLNRNVTGMLTGRRPLAGWGLSVPMGTWQDLGSAQQGSSRALEEEAGLEVRDIEQVRFVAVVRVALFGGSTVRIALYTTKEDNLQAASDDKRARGRVMMWNLQYRGWELLENRPTASSTLLQWVVGHRGEFQGQMGEARVPAPGEKVDAKVIPFMQESDNRSANLTEESAGANDEAGVRGGGAGQESVQRPFHCIMTELTQKLERQTVKGDEDSDTSDSLPDLFEDDRAAHLYVTWCTDENQRRMLEQQARSALKLTFRRDPARREPWVLIETKQALWDWVNQKAPSKVFGRIRLQEPYKVYWYNGEGLPICCDQDEQWQRQRVKERNQVSPQELTELFEEMAQWSLSDRHWLMKAVWGQDQYEALREMVLARRLISGMWYEAKRVKNFPMLIDSTASDHVIPPEVANQGSRCLDGPGNIKICTARGVIDPVGRTWVHLQVKDTKRRIQSYKLRALVAEVGEQCILSLPKLRQECGLSLYQFEGEQGELGDFLWDGAETQIPVHKDPRGLMAVKTIQADLSGWQLSSPPSIETYLKRLCGDRGSSAMGIDRRLTATHSTSGHHRQEQPAPNVADDADPETHHPGEGGCEGGTGFSFEFPVCWFWADGRCSYGQRCKFKHEGSSGLGQTRDSSQAGTESHSRDRGLSNQGGQAAGARGGARVENDGISGQNSSRLQDSSSAAEGGGQASAGEAQDRPLEASETGKIVGREHRDALEAEWADCRRRLAESMKGLRKGESQSVGSGEDRSPLVYSSVLALVHEMREQLRGRGLTILWTPGESRGFRVVTMRPGKPRSKSYDLHLEVNEKGNVWLYADISSEGRPIMHERAAHRLNEIFRAMVRTNPPVLRRHGAVGWIVHARGDYWMRNVSLDFAHGMQLPPRIMFSPVQMKLWVEEGGTPRRNDQVMSDVLSRGRIAVASPSRGGCQGTCRVSATPTTQEREGVYTLPPTIAGSSRQGPRGQRANQHSCVRGSLSADPTGKNGPRRDNGSKSGLSQARVPRTEDRRDCCGNHMGECGEVRKICRIKWCHHWVCGWHAGPGNEAGEWICPCHSVMEAEGRGAARPQPPETGKERDTGGRPVRGEQRRHGKGPRGTRRTSTTGPQGEPTTEESRRQVATAAGTAQGARSGDGWKVKETQGVRRPLLTVREDVAVRPPSEVRLPPTTLGLPWYLVLKLDLQQDRSWDNGNDFGPMRRAFMGDQAICRRFQTGTCLHGGGCPQAHVCHVCGERCEESQKGKRLGKESCPAAEQILIDWHTQSGRTRRGMAEQWRQGVRQEEGRREAEMDRLLRMLPMTGADQGVCRRFQVNLCFQGARCPWKHVCHACGLQHAPLGRREKEKGGLGGSRPVPVCRGLWESIQQWEVLMEQVNRGAMARFRQRVLQSVPIEAMAKVRKPDTKPTGEGSSAGWDRKAQAGSGERTKMGADQQSKLTRNGIPQRDLSPSVEVRSWHPEEDRQGVTRLNTEAPEFKPTWKWKGKERVTTQCESEPRRAKEGTSGVRDLSVLCQGRYVGTLHDTQLWEVCDATECNHPRCRKGKCLVGETREERELSQHCCGRHGGTRCDIQRWEVCEVLDCSHVVCGRHAIPGNKVGKWRCPCHTRQAGKGGGGRRARRIRARGAKPGSQDQQKDRPKEGRGGPGGRTGPSDLKVTKTRQQGRQTRDRHRGITLVASGTDPADFTSVEPKPVSHTFQARREGTGRFKQRVWGLPASTKRRRRVMAMSGTQAANLLEGEDPLVYLQRRNQEPPPKLRPGEVEIPPEWLAAVRKEKTSGWQLTTYMYVNGEKRIVALDSCNDQTMVVETVLSDTQRATKWPCDVTTTGIGGEVNYDSLVPIQFSPPDRSWVLHAKAMVVPEQITRDAQVLLCMTLMNLLFRKITFEDPRLPTFEYRELGELRWVVEEIANYEPDYRRSAWMRKRLTAVTEGPLQAARCAAVQMTKRHRRSRRGQGTG